MNAETLHRTWCIRNDIKIYPIRLETASERYKIGVLARSNPEKIGTEIYTNQTSKTTVGVFDKIAELYKHFYNQNNK